MFLKGKGSLWRHVSSIPDPWLVLTFAPCGDTSKISSSAKFYLDGIITHTHGKKKHQHFKDIYMNKIIKCNKLGLSVLTWLKQNKAGCWLRAENLTSHLCKRRSEQHSLAYVGLSVLNGRKEWHKQNEDVDKKPNHSHFLTSTHLINLCLQWKATEIATFSHQRGVVGKGFRHYLTI